MYQHIPYVTDLFSKSIAGTTLGNVVTFLSSGYLCAYGFDNGWGSIFYVTGRLEIYNYRVRSIEHTCASHGHFWHTCSQAQPKFPVLDFRDPIKSNLPFVHRFFIVELPIRLAVPKISLDVTSENKHSHDS